MTTYPFSKSWLAQAMLAGVGITLHAEPLRTWALNSPAENLRTRPIRGGSSISATLVIGVALAGLISSLARGADENLTPTAPGGAGEFLVGNIFSVGNGPTWIAEADLNKDGKLDLVVANYDDNTVGVLFGTGKGAFEAQKTFHATNPNFVAIADFNDDGNLDILTIAYNFNSMGILFGDGKGGFGQQVTTLFEGTSGCYNAGVADFNRDGKVDIAVACAGGDVVLLGNGHGKFSTQILPGGDTFLVIADINTDGIPDLVGTGTDAAGGYVDVSLGNGDGTFQSQKQSYAPQYPITLTVADFNGDGLPDVAVGATRYGTNLVLLFGNGDGTFGEPVTLVDGGYSLGLNFVTSADIDGDGRVDLVVANSGGDPYNGTTMLLFANGDGSFQPPVFYATGTATNGVLAADLNRDGLLDLAVLAGNGQGAQSDGTGTVTILLGRGNRSFQSPRSYPMSGRNIPIVETADTNRDGKLDLIALDSEADSAAILLGNGDGTFQPASFYSLDAQGAGAIALTKADFNGDGLLDLGAVTETNGNGGNLSILLGYGDGTFDVPKTVSLPGQPYAVASGDFNDDGKQDLVISGIVADVGSIYVFLGQGDGTFQGGPTYSGYNGSLLLAGDLNGDRKLDVVAFGGNGFATFIGNGDGTLQPGIETEIATSILGASLADFNRDGKPDIAASSSDGIYIFLGNGDGTFQSPSFVMAGQMPTGLAVGDINGDGIVDIIALDVAYDAFDVLIGNGDGTFRAPVLYNAGGGEVGFTPIPVLGDFNGDGAADVASPYFGLHDASASVEVVLNTGGTVVSLETSQNPSTAGTPVMFTAHVVESVPVLYAPTPAGSVTFADGSALLGTVTLSSDSANFTTSSLASGTHHITATYSGNSRYNKRRSATLTQTVR